MVTEQVEREDKFDVDPGFVVPELSDLLPDGGRQDRASYQLDNTYYDTAEGDLRRMGITLRKRVGGPDAGWHLKIPAGPARTELRSKSRSAGVPKALADPLSGVRRGQELGAVATISTDRDVLRLFNAAGELMAEIADDQVESATLGESTTLRTWREVEVELGSGGDEALLRALGNRLIEWGARNSPYPSKLRRALGAESESDLEAEPAAETLGALLANYLSTQCVAIVMGDLGLRLKKPVVHPTRVAVRRLRSTMRVFGSAFDADQAAELDTELVWFAGLLGEVRDRDILRRRLAAHVAALPAEYVLGPVAAQIESTLLKETSRHLVEVTRAMSSERYQSLLQTLSRWRDAPPFTDEANEPAAAVAGYVRAAQRKLTKRLRHAGDDVEALHRARKAGKRFRYAAELSAPTAGKKAEKSVKAGKKLQTLLGEHQDSVVSAAFLRRLGAAAGASQEQNGFTYGILLAQEWQRAKDTRRKLRKRYQ
jgi:CHAD domain-containing protein